MNTKLCGQCGIEKSVDEFYSVKVTRKTSKDGLAWQCKDCSRAKAAEWSRNNREKARANHKRWFEKNGRAYYEKHAKRQSAAVRKSALQRYYGITVERYAELFLAQNGLCAICKTKSTENLCVDHDHESGAVRGLLCKSCNVGIGRFEDSQSRLLAAVEYLKSHQR